MTKLSITEAREKLSETVSRVEFTGDRVVLMRNRKRAAALVPVEDLEFLEALEDRLDIEEAKAVLQRMKAKGEKPVPWEQVKAELGL